MSSYQEKITRHTKNQKTQFKETEQASEPDMARMLGLSDQEFKTTMIKMLKALMDRHNCKNKDKKTDKQYKWRDGNPQKEPKRNAREKKTL